MRYSSIIHSVFPIIITLLLCCPMVFPVQSITGEDIPLPMPQATTMDLECALSRRMSIRNFTDAPVSLEDLATILWAAYGYREDKTRTVPTLEGGHGIVIYVLREEAVYTYDSLNHTLRFYKNGDYRGIGQYTAPLQLGLVWDTNKNSDENLTGAEIGAIGQNIQFMAVALNMGTVVTGERPSPLDTIGLPSHHVGKIIMPLGHLQIPYDFIYKPRWISFLPRMKTSEVSLSTILEQRQESTSLSGQLSRQEQSQLLWSSYGFSYLLDTSNQAENPLKRHRTVPSAHGYYPLQVYMVTERGVYRYIPGILDFDRFGLPIFSFLFKIRWGDHRDALGQASESLVSSAPMILVIVLDVAKTNQWDDLSGTALRWIWYYEAGAAAYNVLVEATAWDLSAAVVVPQDSGSIQTQLRLNDDELPLLLIPVGS